MTPIGLKKLLKKETGSIVDGIIQALDTPITIQDAEGKLLLGGEPDSSAGKHPITLDDEVLGWVTGDEKASVVASTLSHLASREYEKKTLSVETLERYKEINLLYTISQKMASCLKPQDVARLIIEEARKVIKASSASVMLLNEKTNTLDIIAAFGTASYTKLILTPGAGVAGNVFLSGRGEIFNDVRLASEFVEGDNKVSSLICIPLKVEDKILGVMNISTEYPVLYTAGELKLATALAAQAAVSIENARLHAEHLERERIVKELEIARDIQQSLLPQSTPVVEGAEIVAMALPAKEVGGDFYDFIPITDQNLGLVIADVSGKGVPAALFMALSRALMRASSLRDPRVSNSVIQTNRLILECAASGLFVTLFYAIVDVRKRSLRYVNAGHNPPILFKKITGDAQFLEADGIALGVLDQIELEEKEIALDEGDVILLYTDGVTESINPSNEEFGEERLVQLIKDHHDLPVNDLMKKIETVVMAFTEDEPQFDDFTMMVVKIV